MSRHPHPHNDLPPAWRDLLDAGALAHLARATAASERELAAGKNIFPPRAAWFASFHHVPPEKVRAVILGQDPYPTAGNAMGLSFSVPRGVSIPASLRNIYTGLKQDLDIAPVTHGDLRAWADQGVLLLNSTLTVEEGKSNGHAAFGWQQFTDAVIAAIGSSASARKTFLLWGAHAQKKETLVDASRHLVLKAPHPSPLSAHRGFYECRHFSQTNAFLREQGLAGIDWQLPG
ncbi:MAG: uracil-DNA glycosylase [Betaproteobacteria bacterium]